jgi:uncharacterized protein with ParB-like and HNH nuclease domain
MSNIKIQATEHPIQKVFSNDFVFTIPLYQRPYAWTTEQAGELLEDLITSLGDGKEPIDDVNPYFLGSIVLIKEKEDKPDAQVVDGQQRLTTLTILLVTLRKLVPSEYADDLTQFLYQKGSLLAGTPNRYRLTLRERDAQFFREYIYDEGGIEKLQELNSAKISDSQRNIKDNAILFLQQLKEFTESQRIRLAQFIVKRCFLVVVSTPDLESAYRIFSVLNDRGLDLSVTDILKAEIIGKLPTAQQAVYTAKWEDTEVNLGREVFKDLFAYIRMIKQKAKPRQSILEEFQNNISPTNNPQQFIEKDLIPFANAFYDIKNLAYPSSKEPEEINGIFNWLKQIDNSDWIPPAILYLSQEYNHLDKLVRFFTDLERLAAGLLIQRANVSERIERYSKLLNAIESKADLYKDDSPLQLTNQERDKITQVLDSDLYLIQRIRLFVLLRLDVALSESNTLYQFPTITVEHVLPQNPASNSVWLSHFPNGKHEKYVHRLGNLVLLSRKKNTEAQNFDFHEKKDIYFTAKTGISPFALTTQVLREKEWTPTVIERRQQNLTDVLKKVWRL